MILICYDGSADARSAVEHAAELFRDKPATVLTVWQPFAEVVARSTVGFGLVPSIPDAGGDRRGEHEGRRADRLRRRGHCGRLGDQG